MLEIPKGSITKMGVPPAFKERCAIRWLDSKFGPNSKGKPMLTLNWELIGYFDSKNELHTTIKRGEIEYKLPGLRVNAGFHGGFFVFAPESIKHYAEFYEKVTGQELTSVEDENNPDLSWLDKNVIMQAIVSGDMQVVRRQLTDEEKEALIAKGEKPIGEPLIDDEGKPIENPMLKIDSPGMLKRYTGDLPEGVTPF